MAEVVKCLQQGIKLRAQNIRFSTTLDEATKITNKRHINVNIHWKGGNVRNLGMISVYGSCTADTTQEQPTVEVKFS